METSPQEISPVKSSPQSANLAQENARRLLEALDKGGGAALQAELDRVYPRTSKDRIDLNPVYLNAAGESVGPDWHRDHPDDYPHDLKMVNLADLTPEQREAVENGDLSTLEPSNSPK